LFIVFSNFSTDRHKPDHDIILGRLPDIVRLRLFTSIQTHTEGVGLVRNLL
jgi:hypothetical protein